MKFNYLKNSKNYIIASIFLTILSLVFLVFGKINLGIDMTGGISLEYSYQGEIDLNKIKKDFNTEKEKIKLNGENVINNINIYSINGEKKISLVVGFIDNNDKKIEDIKSEFRKKSLEIIKSSNNTAEEVNYSNIGKTFGDYIKNTAFLTLGLAIIGIFFYIYYAFSGSVGGIQGFSFGIVTLLTLFHDVIVSTGLYILAGYFYKGFQIDTYFITALLTILGYSINDTIVIFDRIRENLKSFGGKNGKEGKNLYEIVNLSILETFKRSIFTSITLVFVLITILFFGPESLQGFIFVMLIGTIIGTYSSIFLASPIFYMINKNKKLEVYKEKKYNPDDKIVV